MIGRMEKKNLQSSVIVPRNEIDSHPTEHEITLADDTAVTLPETQQESNRNNQHLLVERKHTHKYSTPHSFKRLVGAAVLPGQVVVI